MTLGRETPKGEFAASAVFLSDIHLKSMEERNGQTLLRFFTSLESLEMPPAIFLLGDIFDLWVSDHRVFRRRYEPLISILERLIGRGVRVVYFEGNHDLHLHPFWEKGLGAQVLTGPETFDVAGLKIRCEHGDEMNQDDLAYLRLRRFLRHPLVELAGHRLPGGFWDFLGQKWSSHSRVRSASERAQQELKIRNVILEHAKRAIAENDFDVLVSGHMHVKEDVTFQSSGRDIRVINLGSWFEQPVALWVREGQLEWRNL